MQEADFSKYGKSFQESLAYLFLEDRPFSDQLEEVLNINFFEFKYLQVFINIIIDYKAKYKSHPTKEIMISLLRTSLEDENEAVQKQVRDFFTRYAAKRTEGEDYIKGTSLDFCKKQKLKEAILKSVDLLQSSSYGEIKSLIDEATKLGIDSDHGHDYKKDFELRYELRARNPVATGWQYIDRICKNGLGKGELGVCIASTGSGKSMALVHLGSIALKLGLNVVHYTLELSEEVIGLRYDSCLSKVPLNDLHDLKEQVHETCLETEGELFIKEYPTKTASPRTISKSLEKLKKRDHNVDLIIVDYADLLRPSSEHREKRNELESIYEDLRALAQETECPIWTASQTNRCFWVDTKLAIKREGDRKTIKIGDIVEGDYVDTHKGFRRVSKVFPKETQQTFKITLKSGKTMICSGRHQFPTVDGTLKSIDVKSIDEGLDIADKLLVKKNED